MFSLLFRLAKASAKRTVKFITHPVKSIKKSFKSANPVNIFRKTKKQIRNNKKKALAVKRVLSPSQRRRERIVEKAALIENLSKSESEFLAQKSAAVKDTGELVQKVNEIDNYLKTFNTAEQEAIEKAMDESLKGLGLDSAKDIERAINEDEFRYDLVVNNAYDTFMENWKNGFFAYNPEDLGMSEDEREAVWQEIVETKTFAWFNTAKIK